MKPKKMIETNENDEDLDQQLLCLHSSEPQTTKKIEKMKKGGNAMPAAVL